MSKKKALVTGITGQDGAYLADFLLARGYEVHGIKRRSSLFNTRRVDHLYKDPHEKGVAFFMHFGDMTDSTNIIRVVQDVQPDEIYNLAAQSHVQVSFETPEYTANADALGTLRLLEAVRVLRLEDRTRFYQASTSELFGRAVEFPQRETTPFHPRSPYAAAKLYAYWITVNYREAYGIFACNGILFNHESPVRGETFVTRKITRAAARIVLGLQGRLYMGNMDAKRDWGHARDYVEGMWLMLQQDKPDDYVLATGETHSVREFIECAFGELGVTIEWTGRGAEETGRVRSVDEARLAERLRACGDSSESKNPPAGGPKKGDVIISVDPRYFRPTEVDILQGDASRARDRLGWAPKCTFRELVREMAAADLRETMRDVHLMNGGYRVHDFNE